MHDGDVCVVYISGTFRTAITGTKETWPYAIMVFDGRMDDLLGTSLLKMLVPMGPPPA
jgi:hypothetical protein